MSRQVGVGRSPLGVGFSVSIRQLVPQRSVKRANSATDCTPIFAITWARCILTVALVMPRSPAICLFNLPETTCSSTSRSRRSEEHTSELQSHSDLVCRLLLEKKKQRS